MNRCPGRVPAGSVSNEIVHIVDLYTTLARVGGAEIPKDRPIDGVDQLDFFLGKQVNSNREGFPAYVADRLSAVKDRKSTRLNSSHQIISYAVFCLKKKKNSVCVLCCVMPS